MLVLDPIARASMELGARGPNQNMGEGGRSYDSDNNHPYLPCYANGHEEFRNPQYLNLASYWYRRQGALGVHRLAGAGHGGGLAP